jgi:hypothetical protein
MNSVVVRMTAEQWSAAWRPLDKRLLLPLPGAPAKRQRVAVRIELAGHILHATVVGTITALQRCGALVHADVTPDPSSAGALTLIDAAARGQVVQFRERPRRYLVQLPVGVVARRGEVYMTTVSLSPGGCSLRWSGATPQTGQALRLRFGAGSGKVEVEGTVRWVRGGSSVNVGIRFGDPRAAATLTGVLGAVARSMAPTV